jgi:hypothetical protein
MAEIARARQRQGALSLSDLRACARLEARTAVEQPAWAVIAQREYLPRGAGERVEKELVRVSCARS